MVMSFINIEWKMNVPNALSLVRIVLLPVFILLYLASENHPKLLYWALGILVLSGVTDSLDGIIARKFNQITDLGKILDPLADKLTQVTVVLCLALRYPNVLYLAVICLIKELTQAVGGLFLLHRGEKINGARWFGKVSTFTFYGVMALFVAWGIVWKEPMPNWLQIALVLLVALLMLFAFFRYILIFINIKKTMPSPMPEPVEKPSDNKKAV